MITVKYGLTRRVFLVGKYAIKVPTASVGYRYFLKGMLDNLAEAVISDNRNKGLMVAPVIYCNWTGLFSVMERVRVGRNVGIHQLALAELCARQPGRAEFYKQDSHLWNFGYNSLGEFVKLDYAK